MGKKILTFEASVQVHARTLGARLVAEGWDVDASGAPYVVKASADTTKVPSGGAWSTYLGELTDRVSRGLGTVRMVNVAESD